MKKAQLNFIDNLSTNELIIKLRNALEWTEEEYNSFQICFLLHNTLEEKIFNNILNDRSIKKLLKPNERNIEKLFFSQKINLVKKIISIADGHEQFNNFFIFCKEFNKNIRRNLYHTKIEKISYNGKSLINIETQRKIVRDMFELSGFFE